MQEKCTFERVAADLGIDFISIKRGLPDQNQIVLNPNYTQRVGMSTEEQLKGICLRCNLCRPEIHQDGKGFRIDRHNFIPDLPPNKRPLARFTNFPPKGETNGMKVALVEDFNESAEAEWLSRQGFDVLYVHVDAHVPTTEIASYTLFQKIIDWGPDWVIADKGLGYVNGLELIIRSKEAGIGTIMQTGEIQTNETRKLADFFLEKPFTTDELLEILTALRRFPD